MEMKLEEKKQNNSKYVNETKVRRSLKQNEHKHFNLEFNHDTRHE